MVRRARNINQLRSNLANSAEEDVAGQTQVAYQGLSRLGPRTAAEAGLPSAPENKPKRRKTPLALPSHVALPAPAIQEIPEKHDSGSDEEDDMMNRFALNPRRDVSAAIVQAPGPTLRFRKQRPTQKRPRKLLPPLQLQLRSHPAAKWMRQWHMWAARRRLVPVAPRHPYPRGRARRLLLVNLWRCRDNPWLG